MITHIVSDWLFSPCCVEHQDEFIFERVAVAYSRDYNEEGRAQINNKDEDQLRSNCTSDKCPWFRYRDSKIPPFLKQKFQTSSYLVVV